MSSFLISRLNRPWLRFGALAFVSLGLALSLLAVDAVGGSDWHNYLWASQTAVDGKNPYLEWGRAMDTLPADRWPGRSDLPPLQLLLYMGCLQLGGTAAVYALFAVTHAGTAVLLDRLGVASKRPGLSLLALIWALFPLYTFWFLEQASNKNVMTFCAVLVLLCASKADRYLLEGDSKRSGRWTWIALVVAVFLGNFGWLGFAAVPVLVLSSRWSLPKIALGGAVAALLTLLLHMPYFPYWKVVYLFRFSRVVQPGFHTSPLRFIDSFLASFGIHFPLQAPLLFLIVSVLAVLAYRRPGNSAQSAALAMITMAMVRTDADQPSALMAVIIALTPLQEARHYLYLLVAGTLVYSHLATVHAPYGTDRYAFDTLVPLVLPVIFLIYEVVRFHRSGQRPAISGHVVPEGSEG